MATHDGQRQESTECPTCREDFETPRAMKWHHAYAHGVSIAGVIRECGYCGDPVRVTKDNARKTERSFCRDKRCLSRWMESRPKENHPRWKGGFEKRTCDNCGATVKRSPSGYHSEYAFCDQACHGEWKTKQATVELECRNCGDTFQTFKSQENDRKYCSPGCSDEARSSDATFDYGESWTPERRKAVRKRDCHQCQDCGVRQDRYLMETGMRLDVHHIVPAREFDDHEKRNAMDNLITLCRPCHRKWERIGLAPDNR